MTPDKVVGLKPWFPWPFSRWAWLTQPVGAERLAMLRIGLSLLMFVDVVLTFLPGAGTFFTAEGFGGNEIFYWLTRDGTHRWSILDNLENPALATFYIGLWALFSFTLLIGLFTRTSAIMVWILAISAANANSYIDNAGDRIRNLLLFYLMLCPCGAVWSLDRWYRRRYVRFRVRRAEIDRSRYLVYPWPICLIVVQMCMLYSLNGLYKFSGEDWPLGDSLYFVLGDMTLTRASFEEISIPVWMTSAISHSVLYWEMFFPVLMIIPWVSISDLIQRAPWRPVQTLHIYFRWNRALMLLFGISFHLGIAFLMELGGFPWYAICCYLPLAHWEKLGRKPKDPYQPEQSESANQV